MDIPFEKWEKAIKLRKSRRKYHNRELEPEKLAALKKLAQEINQEFSKSRIIIKKTGFEEVRQKFVGSYGIVAGAKSYAIILGDTEKSHFQIESGCAGEALILEATAREIDTCWIGGFFEPQEVKQQIDIKKNEQVLAVTPLGYARNKTSITEKILTKILKSKDRQPLTELCLGDSLEKAESWMETALKAARLAPSTANLQPWRFAIEDGGITILSTEDKKRHGVSPYLDCGVALFHLIIGAGKEGVKLKTEYLEKPRVAHLSKVQ
ncbi:MAG: nitroreductase family protein [Halanaerobiaceae bacterium]